MNQHPSSDVLSSKYKRRDQFTVKGHVVSVPSLYHGRAITAAFPISYAKAREAVGSSLLQPVKLTGTKSLVSLTIMDFHEGPVGPYSELVYAIPVIRGGRMNVPLMPLLLQKLLKKFEFYIPNIVHSTAIAVEHSDRLVGSPLNKTLVTVEFSRDESCPFVCVRDAAVEILALNASQLKGTAKSVEQSYMTYFGANSRLAKIQMDIYGLEAWHSKCELRLGNHPLSQMLRDLEIGSDSLDTRTYREMTEVFPVTREEL